MELDQNCVEVFALSQCRDGSFNHFSRKEVQDYVLREYAICGPKFDYWKMMIGLLGDSELRAEWEMMQDRKKAI